MKSQNPKKEQSSIFTKSKKSNQKVYECSDARPFKSIFKGGYITPPNYLAELIFQKRSETFNSGKNPEQFWLTGNKLHGAYKGQVIQASRLLQRFDVLSVANAIKSIDAKFIFKLQDPKLIPIIEKFESQLKPKEIIKNSEVEQKQVAKPFGNGSKNILKGL